MTDDAYLPMRDSMRMAAPLPRAPQPSWVAPPAEGHQPPDSVGRMHLRWSLKGPVIELSGEIDLALSGQVAAVRQILSSSPEPVVVDAVAVTFCDIAGLRAVVALAPTGSPVLVLRPAPCVLRLLRVLALVDGGPSVQALGPSTQAVSLTSGFRRGQAAHHHG